MRRRLFLSAPRSKIFPLFIRMANQRLFLVDINVFELIIKRLEELEDEALFSDPEVVMQLKEAKKDHVAGRITSHADLIRELGVEDEL